MFSDPSWGEVRILFLDFAFVPPVRKVSPPYETRRQCLNCSVKRVWRELTDTCRDTGMLLGCSPELGDREESIVQFFLSQGRTPFLRCGSTASIVVVWVLMKWVKLLGGLVIGYFVNTTLIPLCKKELAIFSTPFSIFYFVSSFLPRPLSFSSTIKQGLVHAG